MTYRIKFAVCAAAALAVAGCSSASSLLNGNGFKNDAPDERQVSVGQSLAMPPDLNLPAPANSGEADNDPPQSRAAVSPEPGIEDVGVDPDVAGAPLATAPAQDDIYSRYGIATVKADGTAKSQDELLAELRAAQLAEKKRKNPNYGTIRNIGNIFKDG